MSELEERLNAVLSNRGDEPHRGHGAKLMGELPSEAPQRLLRQEAAGGRLLGSLAGSLPGLLSRLTSGQSGNREKQLADALAPYLSAERARRLSRALRIAGAARIAGRPFRNRGGAAMAYNRYNGSTGERTRVEEPLPPEKAQSGSPLPRETRQASPPPPENEKTPPSPLLSLRSGLDGIFEQLDPKRLETEDLLVLAILWLLYRESGDWEMLIALGAYYLICRDGSRFRAAVLFLSFFGAFTEGSDGK